MREIECEPAAEFRAEVRLAECVVDKTYSGRVGLEIAPQEVTQHTARGNETLPIAFQSKACTSIAFIRREGSVEASRRVCGNVQAGAPTVNFVGCQLKGAR
jgi:hypothetical protein